VQGIHALQKRGEMFKFNSRSLFAPIVFLVAGFAPAANLLAESCNNVKITISNQTGDEVKVKKLEYHSFTDGWRTETGIFGVDGFTKLQPGHQTAWIRDLRDIEGENTFFRVTYAHHHGGSVWDDDQTETSEKFVCNDKDAATVTLTK
jgi:hypothetical protein